MKQNGASQHGKFASQPVCRADLKKSRWPLANKSEPFGDLAICDLAEGPHFELAQSQTRYAQSWLTPVIEESKSGGGKVRDD